MPAVVEFGFNAAPVFSGVDRMEAKLSRLNSSVSRLTGVNLSGMLPAASAIATVGSLRSIMVSMDDLVDASLRLNETTEAVQRVGHASRILASVDVDGVSKAFLRLERSLGELDNKQAADSLADLGLTADELIAMPLEQKMLAFADAFTAARDRGTGYADLMDLLGRQAGELIPLFESGRGVIEEMFAGAPVVMDATVQRLAAANDQLDTWFTTLKVGATESIGTALSLASTLKDIGSGLFSGLSLSEVSDQLQAKQQAALEAQAAQQQKLEDRRKTAAAAIKQATEGASKGDVEKDKLKEAEQIAAAQQRLDEQKRDAALDQMTLAQRIAVMSVDAQKAIAEENRLKSAAKLDALAVVNAESRRVGIQQQILQSQRQLASEKEREAEATKRAADQAAAANATRKAAVLDTMLEYKILQAKAAGRSREVEQIERQARIMERAARLEQENGLGKREAMALAMRMADLEDRANGKRGKITRKQQFDTDPEGRNGLSGRPSGPLSRRTGPLSKGGPLTKNGGLTGFWNMQMGNIGQLGTAPSDYYNRNAFSDSPSLAAAHAQNAAKQDNPQTGTGAVVSELQKLIVLSERGFFG